jgi:predicted nucleic acid-binding Zn finger protein
VSPSVSTALPRIDPPSAPARGMALWVVWGSRYGMGERYSISRVSSRSFFVSHRGRRSRHLLVEWSAWLAERFAEGSVFIDGQELRRPAQLPPLQGGAPMSDPSPVALATRERSFLRAAEEVLVRYRIARRDPDRAGLVRFAVSGGSRDYEVRVRPDWGAPPVCTCPDATGPMRERHRGFCKHVVAVLLSNDDLSCQLLDVLL